MLINYQLADGKTIEIEVTDEVGTFYLESIVAEKKNDRRNSRPDRHTQLSTFDYEDARFFSNGTDILADLIDEYTVDRLLSCLSDRQKFLIVKCCLEGWSYTDLAAREGKDESAIRHAVDQLKKKLRKFLK